jgi:hypothetical protein
MEMEAAEDGEEKRHIRIRPKPGTRLRWEEEVDGPEAAMELEAADDGEEKRWEHACRFHHGIWQIMDTRSHNK